jgi:arabinan endo-1,5-alpha-L-arabinosidase
MDRRNPQLKRSAALLAVLLTAGLVAPSGGAAATAAKKPGTGGTNPGHYSNPLEPAIPGDGVVESCADPTVIQGQEPGDSTWYMYCTTDPLNDEDLNADGDLVFHRIPTMTSEDLVNWTYVGDAFPQGAAGLPSWAEEDAALWAPEVVYSTTHDQYYMFVGVTDTIAAVSGEENCNHDNAIGVATSDSPTGPWTFSEEPVIDPRRGGAGCNFKWTYDPDVLGRLRGDHEHPVLRQLLRRHLRHGVTLTEDGAVAVQGDHTQVAIDNKYEGANVIQRAATTTCSCPPRTAATERSPVTASSWAVPSPRPDPSSTGRATCSPTSRRAAPRSSA